MPRKIEVPAIEVQQASSSFFLTVLSARQLASISYVAVRGQSDEEGAVQRILNRDRITSLRRYALQGGSYPGSIVLNWTGTSEPSYDDGMLSFMEQPRSAQVIDGQHRVEGLRVAIEENAHVGDTQIPVSIYVGLDTRACADLFLSINTEQKPVPRSLVFDLYGIASEGLVDAAAVRARDIAMFLNDEETSPYFENIKMPNQPVRRGGIALSTAVSALKPLVEEKGMFEQIDAFELITQQKIVLNFFTALQGKYGEKWKERSNAFMFAAGFVGAIDFLKLKLIPICNNRSPKDFSVEFISSLIGISQDSLIEQETVKGVGGKDAPKIIYNKLVSALRSDLDAAAEFKF